MFTATLRKAVTGGPGENAGGGSVKVPPPAGPKSRELVRIRRLDDQDIYAAVGESGFQRLIAAFYRQVPGDDILGPMYQDADLAGAEQRLRDFLVGRFGGPQRYIEQRGHPRLRLRHVPFAIDLAARDRWLALMSNALDETKLPDDVDTVLREFFAGVSQMLLNRTG